MTHAAIESIADLSDGERGALHEALRTVMRDNTADSEVDE